MKNFLKRNSEMIGWISGIGIPAALIITGYLAVGSVESSKLDSEYVKIALSILSANPSKKTTARCPAVA